MFLCTAQKTPRKELGARKSSRRGARVPELPVFGRCAHFLSGTTMAEEEVHASADARIVHEIDEEEPKHGNISFSFYSEFTSATMYCEFILRKIECIISCDKR